MEEFRTYILSVTAAGILCAMVNTLAGKGTYSSLLKLMTGVVLATVVISPVASIPAVNLTRYLDALELDAAEAVEAGTRYSREQSQARITEDLEAYILDKAEELGMEITVALTLDEETMVPASVTIEGSASPHARTVMESILQEYLGIPLEALTWK